MKSFEERLTRLENLAEALRDEGKDISVALKEFEEGIKLAQELEKEIGKMEKRVEVLLGKSSEPIEESEPNFELFPDLEGRE